MARFHRVLFVALAAIMVGTLPSPGAADAHAEEIAGLRAQQEVVAWHLEATRDAREVKQTFLEEGRYFVIPIIEEPHFGAGIATRDDALKIWTWMHLNTLGDRPFVQTEFEEYLKTMRDESLGMRSAIEDSIAGMLEDEAKLTRRWRDLEDQIFVLMQADATGAPSGLDQPASTDTRTCAELVESHPTDKPLSNGASLSPQAAVHSASDRGTRRNNPLDITLSWTAPPLRLCSGDTFEIEMMAANAGPQFEDNGINFIAKIDASSSRLSLVNCSNPATWMDSDSESAAILIPTNASYANTCTFRVDDIVASTEPRSFLQISLSTVGERGAGEVRYLYATR